MQYLSIIFLKQLRGPHSATDTTIVSRNEHK